MIREQYDMLVIGGGPGGRRSAVQAAKFGKSVLVIDGRELGGVSVHTGTIPSKTVRESVLNLTGFRERNFYEKTIKNASVNDVFGRVKMVQTREVDLLKKQFNRNEVSSLNAFASFKDEKTIIAVEPNGKSSEIKADKIVISVGTDCFRPGNIVFDGKYVCDSDQILLVDSIPDNVTVIGAGVIGVEYASILNVLGRNVTLIDPRNHYLEFIDRQIIEEFTRILSLRGVDFKLGKKLDQILHIQNEIISLQLDDCNLLETEMVLYAAGRTGATDTLKLDACGINADSRGRISVNTKTFQTEVDHIYAVGDVIGFPALASTSLAQGRIAACHAFEKEIMDPPQFFPYGIYSVPEISTSGQSEKDLTDKEEEFVSGVALFEETSRGQIMGVDCGFLKLLFSAKNHKLLGVHIIGEGAAELIHIGQAVMQFGGGMQYFIENIFNFPTLAEAYKVAALNAWNKVN